MTTILTEVRCVLRKHGYKGKRSRAWKRLNDLLVIIEMQRSQWSDAYYINIGVMPATFMTREYAPPGKYCTSGCRATSIKQSPFFNTFDTLEANGKYDPADLANAFEWLVHWIENQYGNREVVRARELARPPSETLTEVDLMKDWANDKLKDPKYYLRGIPSKYYG